jgi:phytoene dehydrogenase-like protein
MSEASIHVVGGGIAGLSAALTAARRGCAVSLYEAASQLGGRCRTIAGEGAFAHDNGTHVLFTANRRALCFLDAIGARQNWIEPEPEGLPVWDARRGSLARVGLSPWSWRDPALRPDGLALSGLLRLLRLAFPIVERPVGAVAGADPLARSLIEPLTVAILNTPMAHASSKRFARALRRLAMPGAARLLVARRGLDADMIRPAVDALLLRGGSVHGGRRLRALAVGDGRVSGLVFSDGTIPVQRDDRVVLALPPAELARILPELPVPQSHETIVNVHYELAGAVRPRFIGLVGTLSQWVLVRPGHGSVTVSAAGAAAAEGQDDLARQVWAEIAPALCAAGIDLPGQRPRYRVVKERRATIRQAAEPMPQPRLRPLPNLALAGDWIGRLPATIESAVASGERAVQALVPAGGAAAPSAQHPLVAAGGRP